MREQLARWIAALTTTIVVLLSLAFAWIQNPPPRERVHAAPVASTEPPTPEASALADAGRGVYVAQRCSMCHSLAGVGNPRYPLDGVGGRRGKEEIRKWIVGARELEDRLPGGAFRMKQDYQGLPPGDLDALVAFMQSLRN